MADIFESIGRTNALSEETGKLSDMVLKMRDQEARQQQQQVENVRAEKTQSSQLATERVQRNALQQQVEQEAQRVKMDTTIVDIGRTPYMMSKPPEVREALMDILEKAHITRGGKGAWGPALQLVKGVGEDPEEYKVQGGRLVAAWEQSHDRTNKEIAAMEMQAKGNKEKLAKDPAYQAKLQEREIVYQHLQRANGTYYARLEEFAKEKRLHQQALELEREKAKSKGVNKPTALIKNAEYLKQQFPFMAPGDITSILTGQAIKSDRKVQIREEAYRWSMDQGDSPEEARAYANQLDRELSKGSRFDQGAGGQGGVKQPPQGFKDTGRTSGSKKVYQGKDPKTGKDVYWVEE